MACRQKCPPSEDPEDLEPCPGVLQVNYAVTVEPGIYFIPALINQTLANPVKSLFLVQEVIERFMAEGAGGVRIEDVVIVKADAPLVLSAGIPKRPEDITRLH